jgi:hypothetical protein
MRPLGELTQSLPTKISALKYFRHRGREPPMLSMAGVPGLGDAPDIFGGFECSLEIRIVDPDQWSNLEHGFIQGLQA